MFFIKPVMPDALLSNHHRVLCPIFKACYKFFTFLNNVVGKLKWFHIQETDDMIFF